MQHLKKKIARSHIRQHFLANRDLRDSAQIASLVAEANDTADWARAHVVQAVQRDPTRVVVRARSGLADGELATVADVKLSLAKQAERERKRAARLAAAAAAANTASREPTR